MVYSFLLGTEGLQVRTIKQLPGHSPVGVLDGGGGHGLSLFLHPGLCKHEGWKSMTMSENEWIK